MLYRSKQYDCADTLPIVATRAIIKVKINRFISVYILVTISKIRYAKKAKICIKYKLQTLIMYLLYNKTPQPKL